MQSADLVVLALNVLYTAYASSLVLIVILVENGTMAWYQLVCDQPTDGRTDRRTDGRTDGRTDTPSYRDVRTQNGEERNRYGQK